jgi:hypothetical protein
MVTETLQIFAHPDFEERAKLFYEKYDLKEIIIQGDEQRSKKNLKGNRVRRCVFCQNSYPEASFSSYSHLVPQLIGNSNLYSDFECDHCNEVFSGYENDLANFLGVSRSVLGINSEKIAPSFVARKLSAKSRSYISDNILIIAPEDLKIDGHTRKIKYFKNPFEPSRVYKALLKSALSIVGERAISENYKHALDYLKGNFEITKGAFISGYNLSFQLNLPLHIYLFEKKIKNDPIPTHFVVFHFHNNIIAIPIPLHKEDSFFYNKSFDILVPPPYFINYKNMKIAFPSSYFRDLADHEKITNEEEIITFQLDPKSIENTAIYDTLKGEFIKEEREFGKVKYLIIMREGMTIDPEKFSTFIKQIEQAV